MTPVLGDVTVRLRPVIALARMSCIVAFYDVSWACKSRKFHQVGALVINIFHRGLYESPSRSNWNQGVKLLNRGGSLPVFVSKPIATCDFPWGSPDPLPPTPCWPISLQAQSSDNRFLVRDLLVLRVID